MKIKKPRKQHAPRSAVKQDAFTRNGGPMRHKNDRRAKEKEAQANSGSSESEGPPTEGDSLVLEIEELEDLPEDEDE